MLSEMPRCQIRGKGNELNRLAPRSPRTESFAPTDPLLLRLKQMVINRVGAANSKRNYAQALDHLFGFAAGMPTNRALLLEWRAAMENQSPSTVNIRLSAMRQLIAEAKSARMLRRTCAKDKGSYVTSLEDSCMTRALLL